MKAAVSGHGRDRLAPSTARPFGRRQQGQALILVAFAAVALIALTGLALDGGRAYLNRRALQSGADNAAEVAASLLAANFHQVGTPYTDAQVAAQVATAAGASVASGSSAVSFPPASPATCDTTSTTPLTSVAATCAWYTDSKGNLVLWPGAFV